MKKNLLLLLIIISMLFLSACSNDISQEDYDALQSENAALKSEIESLSDSRNENFVAEKNMTISFDFGNREGIYTGTVNSNGLPDGFGKFQNISDSGNDWIYYGEWNNGHLDGNGITQWAKYSHIGLYEMDYMEGSGMYFFDDGSIFCGEFSKSEPITSYVSESDDFLASSNQETTPSSTEKITEGTLYDSITAIYQDVSLTNIDNGLSVQINLPHESYEDDSNAFFYIITSICQSCELEKYYSSIVFSLMVDDNLITMITFVDYSSPSSFSSTEPIVFVDEYKESIAKLYTNTFFSNDIGNMFEDSLDSLKEKYSIED